MKSPLIFNFIFTVILSILVFVLLPTDMLTPNASLAVGLCIGGLVIPLVVNMFLNTGTSQSSNGSSTTLYVGNLPYRANEQAVRDHFSEQGKVFSVRLMKDRRTGKRKGYGFVEIDSRVADKVIRSLNDSIFQERTLKVRLAKDKVAEA